MRIFLLFSFNILLWGSKLIAQEVQPTPGLDKISALEKYTLCYKNYVLLNNKFVSTKDLALKSNESTLTKLSEIIVQFDSCLFFLNGRDSQQNARAKIALSTIETFRLDGLVTPNMQAETLQLWDYGKWAKSVLKIIHTDILPMRKKIVETDFLAIENIKLAHNKSGDAVAKAFSIPKELSNALNTYDYNSLPLSLLTYKKEKLDMLLLAKDPLNSSGKSNFAESQKKQLYYYDMYTRAVKLDTLLSRIKGYALHKEYAKYEEYITTIYRDNEGLTDYFLVESNFIRAKTTEYLLKFRTIAFNSIQEFYSGQLTLPIPEGIELPLFLGTLNNVQTQAIQRDNKGTIYVAGLIENVPFVAKVNTDYSFAWLKRLTSFSGNEQLFVSSLASNEQGCLVSIYKPSISNSLIWLNESGVETSSRTLAETQAARFIAHDDLSDQYIIAYKGTSMIQDGTKSETSLLVGYAKDGSVLWNKKIPFTGVLSNFTKISEGYLWVANYTSLSWNEKTLSSAAGTNPEKTNIFLLKVSADGNTKKQLHIPYVNPIFSIGVVKVTNNNIHLVGYSSDFTELNRRKKFSAGEDILHLRINSNLNVQYNNLLD